MNDIFTPTICWCKGCWKAKDADFIRYIGSSSQPFSSPRTQCCQCFPFNLFRLKTECQNSETAQIVPLVTSARHLNGFIDSSVKEKIFQKR